MKKVVAVLLISQFVIGSIAHPVFAKTTSEKLQEAQQEKAEKQGKLQETQGKIGNLEVSKAALQGYLSELNDSLSDVSQKLGEIEDQLYEKEEEIDKTEEEISELETQIKNTEDELKVANEEMEEQYAFMKKRIRYIYEHGDVNYYDLFFSSKNFSDFLNYAEYINKANEYDQNLLQNMKIKKEEIEEKKLQIENKKEEIEEKKNIQEQERADIRDLQEDAASEQGKVQSLVKQTSSGISEYSGQIAAAENDAKTYEAEIAEKDADIKRLEAELAKERALAEKSRKMAKKDFSQINMEDGERELLACLIYCEAGAEPYEGKIAVGSVVMNRCMSGAFPDTITGVIYQSGQFAPVASGRLAARLAQGANDDCYQAADEVMSGVNNIGDCLFFRTVIPEISGTIIGNHVFYNP